MPKINRNGIKINYETYGNGPALFLTHGFSATSKMWDDQIDYLSKYFTLIVWDMRGHGQTDYPDDENLYNEEETIEDIKEILNELKIEKANVGGMSLGGYMSLAFYCKYPEMVENLLIIDTGPGFKNFEARDSWNNYALKQAKKFEDIGLDGLKGKSKEMNPENHRNAKGLVYAAKGMLTQKDDRIINELPNIKVPTLIIVGENDKPFLAAADYMEKKIKISKKIIIKDAGHAVNIDQPSVFNDEVKKFLMS
tara:strand:- start:497 stop:1252 length:756 start_codon:yes stop_codon:yes gene_type:complete